MIVVTGATGRFGSGIVRTLRALDLPVRTFVRKGSHYYWLNDTGCSYFFGDLRDETSVRRCLTGATHLVVANNIRRESKSNNHRDTTVTGNSRLFALAKELGIQRVVLISCLGVDASQAPAFVARKAAEEALVQSGVDFTILRAAIHEHAFLELAWEIQDRGRVRIPGHGENAISVLPVRDLAKMAAASLDLPSVHNQILEVGGAQPLSFNDALKMAASVVGAKGRHSAIPRPLLSLGARIGKPFRRFANALAEQRVWCNTDLTVDGAHLSDRFGYPLSDLHSAMVETNAFLADMRDPERREARMVHPQFYATVYEPGSADLNLLPDGPAAAKD
jgi:uncharacterized protein YbjT (DUF2867 family)